MAVTGNVGEQPFGGPQLTDVKFDTTITGSSPAQAPSNIAETRKILTAATN
jgi:hypothetical protein